MEPGPVDRRDLSGPFDIIGDVHGCEAELRELLEVLGGARMRIFLGDLVDRGPEPLACVRLVREMAAAGTALCVQGNHDEKFSRLLRGRDVKISGGMEVSARQAEAMTPEERAEMAGFLAGLPSHYVLDGGRLVVAHGGLPEELHGSDSPRARRFALYGDATGKFGEDGKPERRDWALRYTGAALVVYGHTPVEHPEWRNRTINIDTGAVFGGRLTALRYPELTLVSVPARRAYSLR